MTSTPTCLLGKEKSINNRHLQLTEERIKEKYIPHAGYLTEAAVQLFHGTVA